MKHIYLDTNIIIDLLANRTPWSNDAAILFEAAEQGKVRLYTSSLSFVIIYYVLKTIQNRIYLLFITINALLLICKRIAQRIHIFLY